MYLEGEPQHPNEDDDLHITHTVPFTSTMTLLPRQFRTCQASLKAHGCWLFLREAARGNMRVGMRKHTVCKYELVKVAFKPPATV